MARTAKSNNKKKQANRQEEREPFLNPEVRHGIYVVLLWVLGLVSLLSLFNLAGVFGEYWSTGLTRLFGWGDFIIPIIFLILGYLLLRPSKFEIKSMNYWGLGLGVLGFYSLLHWTQGLENLTASIPLGKGGGYVGLILAWPLMKVFGPVAGFVILLAIFLVALLLIFNTSIDRLMGEQNIFNRLYLKAKGSWQNHVYNNNHGQDNGDDEEYQDQGHEDQQDGGQDESEGSDDESDIEEDEGSDQHHEPEQAEMIKVPKRKMPRIELPFELLSGKSSKPNSGDIKQNQQVIERTLANFGISVEMGDVSVGPTVTQYTLRPAEGVKVNQIHSLQNDIALALAAHPIRIEAPIPGKSLVGIEVPNQTVATVTLREILSSPQFQKERPSSLTIALGKDVAGEPYLADLDSMPHMLIAGATGSGKSIAINSLLLTLMYQNQPSDLKFILVDPKRVELNTYADIPFLLTPVITDVKKTINALRWAVGEMDRRYSLLSNSGHRNLATYNRDADSSDRLPYLVIVIDELADLMATAAADVEAAIVRLAQMARAVGIHLVVATQRPSVDVITGLIKANITSRVAFSVASVVDSRTILDSSGAEKLLGRGDMLFTSARLSKPKRLQGAFVSDRDISSVTDYLRQKAKPDYINDVTQVQRNSVGSEMDTEESDELLDEAKEVILRAGKASASLLQRRLRIGYARAARILDILEEQGFIGPADGAKPRELLMSEADLMEEEDFDDTDSAEGESQDEEDGHEDDGFYAGEADDERHY